MVKKTIVRKWISE